MPSLILRQSTARNNITGRKSDSQYEVCCFAGAAPPPVKLFSTINCHKLDWSTKSTEEYQATKRAMRPLTDDEMTTVFEKISKYIGRNVQHLVTRPDEKYCFRLHGNIVYYCSEKLMRQSTNVGTDELLSIGTAVGKLTKSKKFHLRITFLDYLAQYAKYKVWIKPNSEMSFLYGNNVVKSGLGRITEGTPQYAGVVVYSMNDIPLGFGIAAQATEMCKDLEPTAYVVLHQADIGEYLRVEDEMF